MEELKRLFHITLEFKLALLRDSLITLGDLGIFIIPIFLLNKSRFREGNYRIIIYGDLDRLEINTKIRRNQG